MTKTWKALIADDEPMARKIISILMKDCAERYGINLEIHEASDGVECVEQLHRDSFDLMVLDLNMPRVNGFQVLSEVRKLPSKPTTFIVTGHFPGDHPDAMKAVRNGIVEHAIQKPIDMVAMDDIFKRANERETATRNGPG